MPVYEYFCEKCDKKVELMHPMSDDSKKIHKPCGKEMSMVFSSANVFYKGEGWARRG
jgi:putative FmdB family regulatory protein